MLFRTHGCRRKVKVNDTLLVEFLIHTVTLENNFKIFITIKDGQNEGWKFHSFIQMSVCEKIKNVRVISKQCFKLTFFNKKQVILKWKLKNTNSLNFHRQKWKISIHVLQLKWMNDSYTVTYMTVEGITWTSRISGWWGWRGGVRGDSQWVPGFSLAWWKCSRFT